MELQEDYKNSPDGWPDDAVEIETEVYEQLIAGLSAGKVIVADEKGFPVLAERPGPTKEQFIATADNQRQSLLTTATAKIAPLQDAADLDMATDDEKSALTAWKKYRVLLNRVDTSTAPDITWPVQPSA
ncbi:hypothetical protein B2M27_26805 [Kluyvera intermedia]|uniref:Tail fiber assembly protein n=1 Tax=Kluyvera intermedia TaxID=61648 RepID=A0ABX3U718_KLUIN|nr:hypothetical protein B2M27_26805 [Kluyvera intermedia]